MNILDYVNKNKQSFAQCPFNEADSLVLCELSYLAFGRKFIAAPRHTVAELESETDVLIQGTFYPKLNDKLIKAVCKSPRFGSVKIGYFRQRNSSVRVVRFAAVTFLLPDETAYIAFRGTDTTLLGWKEDFYMSFLERVPSHDLAECYLNEVGGKLQGNYIVGGHSKGGNLAVYAVVNSKPSVKERIVSVYNHDGPGFKEGIYDSERYLEIAPLIKKTIPRDSLVGVMLNTDDDYDVVDCNSVLLMQHDPFAWRVKRDGTFKKLSKTSRSSRVFDQTLASWIDGMNLLTRRKLVKAIFEVLEDCGYQTVTEIAQNLISAVRAMNKAYKGLDSESRELLSYGGKQLTRLWLGTVFARKPQDKEKR